MGYRCPFWCPTWVPGRKAAARCPVRVRQYLAGEDCCRLRVIEVGLPPVLSPLERPRITGDLYSAQRVHELDQPVKVG